MLKNKRLFSSDTFPYLWSIQEKKEEVWLMRLVRHVGESHIAKCIDLKLQNIFVPNCKVYFFPNCNIYLSLSLIHPGGERRSLTDEARPSCRWKQKEPKNTYYSTVALTHTHKAISVNKKESKNTQYTTTECLPPFPAVWIDTHKKYSTAFWKEAGLLICHHAMNIYFVFDS